MNGHYRRPQVDLYTALLVLALVAVIVATIFAYLETSDYGEQKYRGGPGVVWIERPQSGHSYLVCEQSAEPGPATRMTG